jgi:hypothetical protein
MTGMTAVSARRRSRVPAALLGLTASLAPATARGMDAEVTSDSSAQFYDVRSPAANAAGDVTILERRRVTTTLGLGLYDLLDSPQGDPKAADISFKARIRYDADYGVSSAETDATNPANFPTVVPGLDQQLFALMYT